jgi:hypothetical protein
MVGTPKTRYTRSAASGPAPLTHGTGVVSNETEALRWYRLAADQGNSEGQFNVDVFYNDGIGVVQDNAGAPSGRRSQICGCAVHPRVLLQPPDGTGESCMTTQRRCGGTVWLQTKETRMRSRISGGTTCMALELPVTMQRHCGGTILLLVSLAYITLLPDVKIGTHGAYLPTA